MLEVEYKSNALMRVCTIYTTAQRKYGKRMAEQIHLRIDQLKSADSVEMLVQYSIGRCHPLVGDRKGEYAMDLVHPYRLVFKQTRMDIQVVRIIEIGDYH